MEINLTLLAQILHFFLAWLIVQKLLLEPALQVIFDEIHEEQKEKKAIGDLQKTLVQKDTYKQACWKECQRQFAAGTPKDANGLHLLCVAQMPNEVSLKYSIPSVAQEEVKKVAEVIAKKIERFDD